MRFEHFAAFAPVCPVCRAAPVRIDRVARADAERVLDATLVCPDPACAAVYPVLDGIPVLTADARAVIAGGVLSVVGRDDLSELADALIADACGPGSAVDAVRQQLSSYAWDHYAEFDPDEPPGDPRPGAAARLLARGLALAGPVTGPALDMGCSAGRTTFELAAATGGLALGIDLNLAKLRLAATVARTGWVRYPRRRVGGLHDRREFAVPVDRSRVDFWACDAAALPLPAGRFGAVLSLNVLDSTPSPAGHLHAAAAALAPGGTLLLGCPYDWSAAAGLGIKSEQPDVPWHVRLHARAWMEYRVHLIAAGRPG